MHAGSLLLVYIRYFVQTAVTHETTMRQRQVRLLADYGRLHFHHLQFSRE